MNVRRIVLGVIIVIVLVGGGYWAYQQFLAPPPEEEVEAAPPVTADTTAVDTGIGVVSAEGTIEPLRQGGLAFEVSGEVADVLASEGTTVETGDPILRLDTSDAETAVTQTEAQLAQAEANLEAAEAGLLAAQAGLQAADIGVTAAEVQLALVTSEPLAQEVAVQESQVAQAQAGVTQAAANRDVVLESITQAQIRAAEAELAAAEAAKRPLQEALSQLARFEIENEARDRLELQVNAAQARVNAAQTKLNELRAGVEPSEQQAANAAVAAAAAQQRAAQAQLDLLQAGPKPEQVRIADIGVEQATARRDEAELALELAQTAVTQAEASVNQAEVALALAQAALEKMTLRAPFAGRIGQVNVDVGEVVAPGVPVVTMADFEGWLVKTTDLTELDVVNVAVGYEADVQVDAIPDETIKGTVIDIASVSELTRGDVTYEVTIRLDEEEAAQLPLRWGMTVFVEIDAEQ